MHKMENSVWRPRARILAFLEIALICISIPIYLFMIAQLGISLHEGDAVSYTLTSSNETDWNEAEEINVAWELGIHIADLLVIVVYLWAAIKLVCALKVDQDPLNALKMAKIYTSVKIFFLVLYVIRFLAVGDFLAILFCFLWDGAALFIVFKFINELSIFVTYFPNSGKSNATFEVAKE